MKIKDHDEPTVPRPPAAEINRVYHDLATVLSDAAQDADGRRAMGQDALRERLKSVGHSLAAIEWAVHLFCEDGLLRASFLEEKHVRTIRPGVSEAKARTIDVPAIAATEKFWECWQTGTFASSPSRALDPYPGRRTQDAVSAEVAGTPLALVMKGGGIKGLAYVGALEILDRKYKFNWFIGTSAGAITAILLAAGFTHDELLEILRAKDFRDFFDAKWYQMPFNLLFHKGFHHSNSFTEWMDELLAKKLKSQRRVRLSDLPNRVTVYASKRGTDALKFDSFDSDADAAYAARCSMSIPWVFVPQSNQGLRTYDGGIQHNYPVDRLLEDYPGTKFISLYLGAEIYEPIKSTSVLADLISITTEASDPDAIEKYRDSTVIIDPRPIRTLDFALTDNEKEFLLATRRVGALVHLEATSEECVAAAQRRDILKRSVEDARSTASLKRRRRRCWTLVTLLLLIGGFATWWLWPNGGQAKINGGTPEPLTDSAGITKDADVTPLERAKLAATLLPQVTSKDADVVSQAEMLRNAVATGTLDHATAIDIAPTFVRRGLSNEHFLRVVGPSIPYALDRVAARGLQLLSEWEQLGETPSHVYESVDGIKPALLPVVKERNVWRQTIADSLSLLPSPSRSDLTKQVRGLYFLMKENNEPASTELFRNPHRTIRLVGALNCVIQNWGPRKEAASAISTELCSLDLKNVDDLSFVEMLLDLLVVYSVEHYKRGTWTDTSISPTLAESLAKLAVDGTFRHRVAWIPDAAAAEDREKWFAEEKAALKHSSVCFRAGELLNLMKTRAENAEAVLIAHIDEFCREVNTATDGTALDLLASRYGTHSVRFAVSVLGALGTPNANAAIRKIRGLGKDKLRAFEGIHWELEALDQKTK